MPQSVYFTRRQWPIATPRRRGTTFPSEPEAPARRWPRQSAAREHGLAHYGYQASLFGYRFDYLKTRSGWNLPRLETLFEPYPLDTYPTSRSAQHERAGDLRQHAGHRPGGDTWRVVKDARGNRSFRVWERFPGSNWGYLNCDSAVLAPGPEGAIATVRYEVLREGLQECGARVAIEQALIDQAQLAPRKGRSSAPHGCPAHGLLDSIPPPVRMALVMQGEGTTPAFETPKTRILASLKRGTGAMKCQKCTKPATLHITEILGEDQFEELHLCEECAHKYLYEPAKAGAGKTAAVPQSDEGEEVGTPNHECPVCGIKFVEFRNSGRLGCPHDYQEFRDELLPLLENIHGDPPRHTGKVPRRLPQNKQTQSELMQLRKQLLQAVNKEAYEEAARLRDRIRQLEES